MNKLIMIATLSAVAVTMTGCMTERSHLVTEGETAEVTAGFSEDEIRAFTQDVVQKINAASKRYAIPGKRRIVNVKNIVNDTQSRGNDAAYLSETIAQCLKEELLNGGMFIVYNERVGAAGTVQPEFVLDAKLMQRNMRRDNGNFYQEFSLNIQMMDMIPGSQTYGLEFFNRRFPIRKGVDKANAM